MSVNPQQRRFPALRRKISEIRPEDRRVFVMGTVVGASGNTLVIDDGTGKISIGFEEPVAVKCGMVRVFGKVIPTENGADLQGELLQDMAGLDTEIAKRIEKLEKDNI